MRLARESSYDTEWQSREVLGLAGCTAVLDRQPGMGCVALQNTNRRHDVAAATP